MNKRVNIKKQKGSVIIICLMFLMGLSLIAASAMKASNLNAMIIFNELTRESVRYDLLRGIEQLWHDQTKFATGQTTYNVNGRIITLDAQCIHAIQAEGYGVNFGALAPQERVWEIVAQTSVNHSSTGRTEIGVVHGILMKSKADGNC